MKEMNISIFGSCVSRDVFEYADKKNIIIKNYIARQSIVSSVSSPIVCNLEDIELDSKFQKEQVYGDLIKNTFTKLKNDSSEYLIIDLIDERFPLIQYNNSILTYSNELMSSGYIKNIVMINRNITFKHSLFRKRIRRYKVKNISINYYLEMFCEEICQIYECEKIIIHKVKMLDFYKDKNGHIRQFSLNYLKHNKKINDLLECMYDYLIKRFAGANVIDICDDFVADERHKWGLAPMHYQEEYYLKALDLLNKYISPYS